MESSVPSQPVLQCPKCHQDVGATNYFCANCGQNLKPVPPSTSMRGQLTIYLGSIFLPPMGLIWGLRYLRQKDPKSKTVGWVAIVLTVIVVIVATKLTVDLINNVNTQVNQQLQNLSY